MKGIIISICILTAFCAPSVRAADINAVMSVAIGASRGNVYAVIGNADTISSNGLKNIYTLNDGRTAVLQYAGDTLKHGYILN